MKLQVTREGRIVRLSVSGCEAIDSVNAAELKTMRAKGHGVPLGDAHLRDEGLPRGFDAVPHLHGFDDAELVPLLHPVAFLHGQLHHLARNLGGDVDRAAGPDPPRCRDDRLELARLDRLDRDGGALLLLERKIGPDQPAGDDENENADEDLLPRHELAPGGHEGRVADGDHRVSQNEQGEDYLEEDHGS